MIFEETLEGENDDHVFLFGGDSHYGLYRLTIEWSPEGKPVQGFMVLEPQNDSENPIHFRGSKDFHPNIPNKKYLPDQKTWIFVDNSRNYYTYNTITKEVKHTILKDP